MLTGSIADALGSQSAAELGVRILGLLPAKQAQIAKALDRQPSDGTVRRTLSRLEEAGAVARVNGVWTRSELPMLATPAMAARLERAERGISRLIDRLGQVERRIRELEAEASR